MTSNVRRKPTYRSKERIQIQSQLEREKNVKLEKWPLNKKDMSSHNFSKSFETSLLGVMKTYEDSI